MSRRRAVDSSRSCEGRKPGKTFFSTISSSDQICSYLTPHTSSITYLITFLTSIFLHVEVGRDATFWRDASQGPFKEGDDLLAVMKSIESIDARRGVTTVQGVLYSHLIEAEANRLLETIKRKANETRDHASYAKVKWRNWFSLMNSDSGAWLTAGGL